MFATFFLRLQRQRLLAGWLVVLSTLVFVIAAALLNSGDGAVSMLRGLTCGVLWLLALVGQITGVLALARKP